jgi:hypothetical protein
MSWQTRIKATDASYYTVRSCFFGVAISIRYVLEFRAVFSLELMCTELFSFIKEQT